METFNETAHWRFESVNPTAWVEQKYSWLKLNAEQIFELETDSNLSWLKCWDFARLNKRIMFTKIAPKIRLFNYIFKTVITKNKGV